ncbi:MAG: hypothetical protein JOZ05_09165 [Acetobacteraceae bacterium]|nr:hypothetical protein [Acetobacteraceae bacterium]
MPSEVRHILFRPAEVVQAIREYLIKLQQKLPSGLVVEYGPETDGPDGAVRFRMIIAFSDGKPSLTPKTVRQEIVIETNTLAAALILYCRDRHIPLPAGADKVLQRFGEQVGLITTYNARDANKPSPEHIQI